MATSAISAQRRRGPREAAGETYYGCVVPLYSSNTKSAKCLCAVLCVGVESVLVCGMCVMRLSVMDVRFRHSHTSCVLNMWSAHGRGERPPLSRGASVPPTTWLTAPARGATGVTTAASVEPRACARRGAPLASREGILQRRDKVRHAVPRVREGGLRQRRLGDDSGESHHRKAAV